METTHTPAAAPRTPVASKSSIQTPNPTTVEPTRAPIREQRPIESKERTTIEQKQEEATVKVMPPKVIAPPKAVKGFARPSADQVSTNLVQFDEKDFSSHMAQEKPAGGTKVITTKPATNVQAYEPVGKPQIAKQKAAAVPASTTPASEKQEQE
jgi:hypothetical protein